MIMLLPMHLNQQISLNRVTLNKQEYCHNYCINCIRAHEAFFNQWSKVSNKSNKIRNGNLGCQYCLNSFFTTTIEHAPRGTRERCAQFQGSWSSYRLQRSLRSKLSLSEYFIPLPCGSYS